MYHQAGGINPAAVDAALKLGAVIVWMLMYHSLAHYQETGLLGAFGAMGDGKRSYPMDGIFVLDQNGELVEGVYHILELVRQHNAIIATGHLSTQEALMVIEAAQDMGCKRIVMTHPFFAPPECSVDQALRLGSVRATHSIPSPSPSTLACTWKRCGAREPGASSYPAIPGDLPKQSRPK